MARKLLYIVRSKGRKVRRIDEVVRQEIERRREQGLSYRAIRKALGVVASKVYNFLNGGTVNSENLSRMAQGLGLELCTTENNPADAVKNSQTNVASYDRCSYNVVTDSNISPVIYEQVLITMEGVYPDDNKTLHADSYSRR